MKKSLALALALILCVLLCGCAEDTTTAAIDPTLAVKDAYEAENYKQVIELLAETEPEDSELQDMLVVSKAHEAYDAESHEDVVSLLDSVSNGKEFEIYSESLKVLCQNAFDSKDIDALVALVNKDDMQSAFVYELVTDACAAFDYDAFLFMDELTAALPECALKDLLSAYSDNSFDIRAKSFLLGEWEWQMENTDIKTRVSTYLYAGDKVLGEITTVGTHLNEYQYNENDLYWKDFGFTDEVNFTCYNLTRTTYGTMLPRTVSGYLDYENDSLAISVKVNDPGISLTSPERVWIKVG